MALVIVTKYIVLAITGYDCHMHTNIMYYYKCMKPRNYTCIYMYVMSASY